MRVGRSGCATFPFLTLSHIQTHILFVHGFKRPTQTWQVCKESESGSPLPNLRYLLLLTSPPILLLVGKCLEFCWSLPGIEEDNDNPVYFPPWPYFHKGCGPRWKEDGVVMQEYQAADEEGQSPRSDRGSNGKPHLY